MKPHPAIDARETPKIYDIARSRKNFRPGGVLARAMDAPPSNPQRSWSEPRALNARKGTLLGFPAMIPSAAGQQDRLEPIIPCDEPEDEDVVQWVPRPRVASPEPVFVAAPVDDPVILPMERRFFWVMSIAILIALASAVALRLAL